MKDPPSKIQMGPQQAVAGGGTFKSSGGTDKTTHAISLFSLTQVLQLLIISSCPRRPHLQLSHCQSEDCFFETEDRTIFLNRISTKNCWKEFQQVSFTCTVEWIHKSHTSIFSQLMFLSNIWTALFEKEPWKVKPPLKSRDFPSFLWALVSSPPSTFLRNQDDSTMDLTELAVAMGSLLFPDQ